MFNKFNYTSSQYLHIRCIHCINILMCIAFLPTEKYPKAGANYGLLFTIPNKQDLLNYRNVCIWPLHPLTLLHTQSNFMIADEFINQFPMPSNLS